jgi:protein gp37
MMGKTSQIEWTDSTWNPWMGCTKVSDGCKHCYMFREQKQYGHDPNVIRRSKTTFRDPLKWEDPRMIFVCSWSDFFHEDVPVKWRQEAMEIIYLCPHHTFLLLTKRPENVRQYVMDDWWKVCTNAWLGVTAENQEMADERIPLLMNVPAARRFVSAEPLLGPLDLRAPLHGCPEPYGDPDNPDWQQTAPPLDWVIVGGESGRGYRVMEEEWAIDLRDQCASAGIPFFFKQWSAYRPKKDPRGMVLDGKTYHERPKEEA